MIRLAVTATVLLAVGIALAAVLGVGTWPDAARAAYAIAVVAVVALALGWKGTR